MSKAELFQELETLSPEELDQVAERVDKLRFPEDESELSAEQLAMIRARIEHYEKNPDQVVDGEAAVAEIMAGLKK